MDESFYEKLSSLSEISKAQLAKIFQTIPASKDLMLEPTLIKPLERICGVSWLKDHGIDKIYKMDATSTYRTGPQFYMMYTNVKTFNTIIKQILSVIDVNHVENDKYHIICVPKSLYSFEDIVEENGLWNIVKLYSFQWMPLHLDRGVLSLELPSMFKEIFIKEDLTLLPAYAKSLWQLILAFGKPSFQMALGHNACIILKQLDKLLENTSTNTSDIGGLIVIDRNVDYASSLLTPVTYSALLHDIYGVVSGVCKYEDPASNETSPEEKKDLDNQYNKLTPKQPINLVLDSKKDSVYKIIKDKHFTHVTEILRILIRDLKLQGETSDLALDEMKRYVQTKLHSMTQKKKLITNHLNASETIVAYLHNNYDRVIDIERNIMQNRSKSKNLQALEEYLQTENNATNAFALFLLLQHVQKLSDSEIKSFISKVFIEFGYNLGFMYRNLVKANVIESLSTSKLKLSLLNKSNFFANANKMKQIIQEPQKIDFKAPNCCSYVYGGVYVPIIAQIAGMLLSGSLIDDVKSKLANFGELQVDGHYQNPKKSLLVYFIGGITYSEIATLNLLESLMGVRIIKLSDQGLNYIIYILNQVKLLRTS